MTRITRYKQSLYQDWKDVEITQQEYRDMKANYKRQAAEQSIETLTHEILTDLVDHIKIYENGNISVHFKFTALFWTFISVGRITKVPSYLTV